MTSFSPTYRTKFTKDYEDMISDDITKRYRCNGIMCSYRNTCPHYRDEMEHTTGFIFFHFRKYDNMCPMKGIKQIRKKYITIEKL